MRKPHGFVSITGPDHPDVIRDTIMCCHCNSVRIVQPKESASTLGGFCTLCASYTCEACAKTGECKPFEKQLEAMEARGRLLAAVG